jgi:hypothetical protein
MRLIVLSSDRKEGVMSEKWKDVPGFEGIYKISNLGRLKSFKQYASGRVLSNKNTTGWYFSVILEHKSRRRYTKIHQLVAECFLNFSPTKGFQIHHKDGNKQNNRAENLEIVSTARHIFLSMSDHPDFAKGMKRYNQETRPSPVMQFNLDGVFVAEFKNCAEASIATGICRRNINQVASKAEYKPGKIRKQAGGFIWKLKTKTHAA